MANSSSENYQRGDYFLPGYDQLGNLSVRSLDQIGFYLRAMFIPRAVEPTLLSVSADIVWTLAVAYFIIFLPLLPRFEKVLAWYENLALRRTCELVGAYGLLLFALARISTFSYKSFLYFRF